MNAVIKAFWQNPIGVNQVRDDPMVLVVPFGAMIPSPTGGGAVDSVNGLTGVVVLDAADVGADPAGTAEAVRDDLQPQITGLSNTKLDAVDYVQHFLGVFASYSALTTAHPTASDGDYAQIDSGVGFERLTAIWDSDDSTWRIQQAGAASNTDEVPEGSNNLYFTAARVRATPLTGLVAGTNTSILATDELLAALAKLQAQVDARRVITWDDVTKVPAALAFGYADNSHPLQVGKDADGNVWVRGVIRNTGGSSIAGFADIMTVPATYKFKWLTSSSHYLIPSAGAYFHNIASSTSISGATFLTARASALTNWLGISTTLPAGSILVFPEQPIGFLE